jgi:hypothetical protein
MRKCKIKCCSLISFPFRPDSATEDSIAAEAEVSKGFVYLRFDSKKMSLASRYGSPRSSLEIFSINHFFLSMLSSYSPSVYFLHQNGENHKELHRTDKGTGY